MAFVKITEQPSLYDNLEKKSVLEILQDINTEDQKVALAVKKAIPQIEKLVSQIVPRMKQGGRIFYMGAGTSGRLGVLDASEIPPTFGMPPTLVIGLIAGGDTALPFRRVDQGEAPAQKRHIHHCIVYLTSIGIQEKIYLLSQRPVSLTLFALRYASLPSGQDNRIPSPSSVLPPPYRPPC